MVEMTVEQVWKLYHLHIQHPVEVKQATDSKDILVRPVGEDGSYFLIDTDGNTD